MSFLVILAPFTNSMQNANLFSMIKHASPTPQSRVPAQSPFCDMTLEKNNTHCQGIKLLRSFKRWRLEVGVDKNEVNCAWIIRINSAWNFPSRKMKPAKKAEAGITRHFLGRITHLKGEGLNSVPWPSFQLHLSRHLFKRQQLAILPTKLELFSF